MKKYDVPLALASTKSIDKLALARMLIDMMELDELYEPLSYKGSFGNLKKLDTEEYFDMLAIIPEERMHKIEVEDSDEFKNYDVALSMSAGNIDDARQVMELLKSLNPKKPLDPSDFETIDNVSDILDEITDKMGKAKAMLERKNLRDKLSKHLVPDKNAVKKIPLKKSPDKLADFKKGHDFEQKVALWAKTFFEANEIDINIRMNGLAVKRPYEVDVHVLRKVGISLNQQNIWIECKNLSSIIKRDHILLLKSKMKDVEDAFNENREKIYFDKGAIASTSDFDSDAILAADNEIACIYYNKTTNSFTLKNKPEWI